MNATNKHFQKLFLQYNFIYIITRATNFFLMYTSYEVFMKDCTQRGVWNSDLKLIEKFNHISDEIVLEKGKK